MSSVAQKLSNKQRVFVEEYLKCWNATEAARRAGYSEHYLNTNASKLLRNTTIEAAIQARIDEKAMSADELLLRIADQARGDLSRYILPSGEPDIELLKADGMGHLLKKYKKVKKRTVTKDGREYETEYIEAELYPSDGAHDKLMRYHGLYDDRVKVEDWQSDVVGLLRDGRLSPEDVRAAYPDLATQLLARAGIDANSNN